MLCGSCGYNAPDEAKYCQECGNKLKIAGDPLTELNWDTLPEKFSVEDWARFLGIPEDAEWNLSCKPRFPERNNIVKKDKLKDWFISTGWKYKPPPPPKPPAPPPAETVEKVDWAQVPAVLDAKEMLAIFRCSRYTLDVFTRHPAGIPHFRVGRSIRYKTEEVIKWARRFKEPMATKYLEGREPYGREIHRASYVHLLQGKGAAGR